MNVSLKIITPHILQFQFNEEINDHLLFIIQSVYLFCKNELQQEIYDVIPAYNSIMVKTHHPITNQFKSLLEEKTHQIIEHENTQELQGVEIKKIPVCYDARLALDQALFLKHCSCSWEEIIELHCQAQYRVYMIGFLPGFAYMGIVPEILRLPRLSEPRKNVPQGSVAIAHQQTGIYPFSSPGGWNIIGQTPLKMFNLNLEQPTFLKMGDQVQFYPISIEEFQQFKPSC